MFTKKSLIVSAALMLALIGSGLVAASAHTIATKPTAKPTHPPFALVRHVKLPELNVNFPKNDKVPILGQVLPQLNNLPELHALTNGGMLGGVLQNANSLLNNLLNLNNPNVNNPNGAGGP